jgi:nitrile hydratase
VTPRFAPGEVITVREDYPPGHVRTPVYVRGKHGVVDRVLGEFRNPEILAMGGDGLPKKTLYRIRFEQRDLWPDYSGSSTDALFIDLYEHWLVKSDGSA